ncbi:Hypothetical protein A7982_09352 [Minicystis rosea]|nr:Hypothetical protein A7982_09352 [Minicystis rosea]
MSSTASDTFAAAPTATVALSPASAPPAGRLAVMTAYAVAATIIPIPFVPDRVLSRVRGALVFDIASRHGLSLTTDARASLSEPDSEIRTKLVRTAEAVARQILRRVGPLALVASASRGVEIYALGVLFERYLTTVRRSAALRVHQEEARLVREAIDRALLRAISPTLRPRTTTVNEGVEDLRDEFTRWIDALLITSASVPSYLERRLEAAFDEVVSEMPGLRNG